MNCYSCNQQIKTQQQHANEDSKTSTMSVNKERASDKINSGPKSIPPQMIHKQLGVGVEVALGLQCVNEW